MTTRSELNTTIAIHGGAIAMLDTNDSLLILPASALSWRRAATLEKEGYALLGLYTAPNSWALIEEDIEFVLCDYAPVEGEVA